VTVTLLALGSRAGRTVVADASGTFRLPRLPAGRFELIARLEGFTTINRNVRLREGRSHEVDVELPLSLAAEEIVVSASGASSSSPPGPSRRELERQADEDRRQALLKDELNRLNQGLVGGVRPLPVEIPETGKLLFLAGALPPPEVQVLVSVKGR